MKNVLILCDLFPPAFGPRMGYLCKYLKRYGWKPYVVTERVEDTTFDFLLGDVDVEYVKYYQRKGFLEKLEWLFKFFADVLFGYKDRKILKIAQKLVFKYQFEVILCSTYRTFPLRAAVRLSDKTGLPLVVDLRDIVEQYSGNEFIMHRLPKLFGLGNLIASFFKKWSLQQRNNILRKAVCVTTISPWHVSILKKYNDDVRLIYNGFDPEVFYPMDIEAKRFYLTYTGRLHSTSMRNPDLLFRAMEILDNDGIISPDLFQVRWFVDDKSRQMIETARQTYPSIAGYMDFFGYVAADKIAEILNESSMILLLTNKAAENGPKGVMTTKFFEAVAVHKPILCVRGDEGCLEEEINRIKVGLSAHCVEEVCEFIKIHYLRWKSTKSTTIQIDESHVGLFSRKEQAKEFVEIFEQVSNNKKRKK